MKSIVTGLIITCGTFVLGSGAWAQDHGRPDRAYFQDRDHDRDHDRDGGGYWGRERMSREYRGAFYDRLQADLTRAENARYLRGDEMARFNRAHREVSEFQDKWSRGVFDPREMDEAIGAVQRVVDTPGLHREDQENLRQDLYAMRRFRAHMEGRRY